MEVNSDRGKLFANLGAGNSCPFFISVVKHWGLSYTQTSGRNRKSTTPFENHHVPIVTYYLNAWKNGRLRNRYFSLSSWICLSRPNASLKRNSANCWYGSEMVISTLWSHLEVFKILINFKSLRGGGSWWLRWMGQCCRRIGISNGEKYKASGNHDTKT